MEERLQWIKLQPSAWAHWEPVKGGAQIHAALTKRYPDSKCFVASAPGDSAKIAIEKIVKPWWHPSRWRGPAVEYAAPPAGSVQMLWANMALHMAADPQALMAQWHRALATDGFLMFSCLGPDTIRELRDLYAEQGWAAPAHEFTDMHDWGDMLVGAGFAEPVMDMERIVLTFETPERLLQELRELGRNLHIGRFAGLRGRGWLARLRQALAAKSAGSGAPHQSMPLQLTFEIIYGHALKPPPRLKMAAQTTLSLDDMRSALQRGKQAGHGPD